MDRAGWLERRGALLPTSLVLHPGWEVKGASDGSVYTRQGCSDDFREIKAWASQRVGFASLGTHERRMPGRILCLAFVTRHLCENQLFPTCTGHLSGRKQAVPSACTGNPATRTTDHTGRRLARVRLVSKSSFGAVRWERGSILSMPKNGQLDMGQTYPLPGPQLTGNASVLKSSFLAGCRCEVSSAVSAWRAVREDALCRRPRPSGSPQLRD
ncbi:hypothetical protein MHYP_G00156290 [Metynnis hypsauchen]